MKRRLAALASATLMIALTGCGQVQDAANKAVSDGASQVATAAGSEVKKQACTLVEDGLISIKDKELLGGLVAGAETAGAPARNHHSAAPDRRLRRPGSGRIRQGPSGRLRQIAAGVAGSA